MDKTTFQPLTVETLPGRLGTVTDVSARVGGADRLNKIELHMFFL